MEAALGCWQILRCTTSRSAQGDAEYAIDFIGRRRDQKTDGLREWPVDGVFLDVFVSENVVDGSDTGMLADLEVTTSRSAQGDAWLAIISIDRRRDGLVHGSRCRSWSGNRRYVTLASLWH
jgi:hypothetical protein